jgi:hypothetical protein
MGEWRYSFTTLDFGTRWSASRLGGLVLGGKTPSFDRRVGGPQSRSGRCGEKTIVPAGSQTQFVQAGALAISNELYRLEGNKLFSVSIIKKLIITPEFKHK